MSRIRCGVTPATLLVAALAASGAARPSPLRAQRSALADDSTTRRAEPLLARRRMLIDAAAGVSAAVAVAPFDARLQTLVRRTSVQRSGPLRRAARFANGAGDPGAIIASVALFGAGRLARWPRIAALGLHATEAIAASGTTSAALKLLFGRQRPFVEHADADDFVPGRGFQPGRASLPSGHTTAAFAFASAISTDVRRWHPTAGRLATPLLYAGASAVGLARMYDDEHWASDVMLGAAVGTFVGSRAVAYAGALSKHSMRLPLAVGLATAPDGRPLGIVLRHATR